ncbi:MAG: hypothetical protein SGPRY_008611, partial [Prymnesium sp.]
AAKQIDERASEKGREEMEEMEAKEGGGGPLAFVIWLCSRKLTVKFADNPCSPTAPIQAGSVRLSAQFGTLQTPSGESARPSRQPIATQGGEPSETAGRHDPREREDLVEYTLALIWLPRGIPTHLGVARE